MLFMILCQLSLVCEPHIGSEAKLKEEGKHFSPLHVSSNHSRNCLSFG